MNGYPTDYPCHGLHICHGCGSMAPHHSQESLPDNGWTFDLNDLGYYGGFTDSIGEEPQRMRLCHDCVLKFLRTFPLISMFIQPGSHNMFGPDEKPCCRYAWKSESIGNNHITLLATEDGESWTIM